MEADEALACHGLTKRELFAGMAMQGLLASDSEDSYPSKQAAAHAVVYADALLLALARPVKDSGSPPSPAEPAPAPAPDDMREKPIQVFFETLEQFADDHPCMTAWREWWTTGRVTAFADSQTRSREHFTAGWKSRDAEIVDLKHKLDVAHGTVGRLNAQFKHPAFNNQEERIAALLTQPADSAPAPVDETATDRASELNIACSLGYLHRDEEVATMLAELRSRDAELAKLRSGLQEAENCLVCLGVANAAEIASKAYEIVVEALRTGAAGPSANQNKT